MIRIEGSGTRLCDGTTRRELLRFGGLAALGAAGLPQAAYAAVPQAGRDGFGKAKRLLFISLFGGPAHQDMWDMKPGAPAEVRGEFKPIRTNVSGIEICEHMPKLAQAADKYALVRSVTHKDNGHGSAMYASFTGFAHPLPNTNPIPNADDRPAYGSIVSTLRPPSLPVPAFMAVGGTQFVCGNQIPGQRAGFLGPAYEPFVIDQDPSRANFGVPELNLPKDLSTVRLDRRRSLLSGVEQTLRLGERGIAPESMDVVQRRAFDLLTSTRVRNALDLSGEKAELRDRYGRTRFGQSLILARRLLEAGVPVTTVNWSTGGSWDTHGNNFNAMKNTLLPGFDQSFSAVLQDFADRGLLEDTLIVATGEFGRTPAINKDAGRDHWAGVYTVVLAGGGVRGGVVHGTSDEHAGYPASDAVGPWDIAATVFHCLGIHPQAEIRDRTDRPLAITQGNPIRSILG